MTVAACVLTTQDFAKLHEPLACVMDELKTLAAAYVDVWKTRQKQCSGQSQRAWKAQPQNRNAVDAQVRSRHLIALVLVYPLCAHQSVE